MTGFVMMIGVIVNDSILLVAAIRAAEALGVPMVEAIRAGLDQRLRAIVASTPTGALPMALSAGPGSVIYRGLAAVNVAGVIASLVFSYCPTIPIENRPCKQRRNAVPKNVIFDLGGVLLDWNPARIMEMFSSDPTHRETIRAALFRHADWLAFNRGELSETQFKDSLSARTGLSIDEIGRLLIVVRRSLVPKQDTVELLGSLHRQGVELYCLTDMPSSIFEYINQQFEFLKLFKGIVVSGDVGMLKPDVAIFAHLLSRFSLHPEDTIFIDDHPPNVEGAKRVGLHTITFATAAECRAELIDAYGVRGLSSLDSSMTA